MKVIRYYQYGDPEVFRYEDADDPKPDHGEALIELQAIGVNFSDVYSRSGIAKFSLPWITGTEGAGIVTAIGPQVTEVGIGDRVAYFSTPGSYAEKVIVPSWRLIKIPETVSSQTAAAVMVQGMTAHYLAHETYKIQRGDSVLIHAGAGGVGRLLIQMAKRMGAFVITTVSTEIKAKHACDIGADQAIIYTQTNFTDELQKTTNYKGVAAVFDSVGITTFSQSLECLAPRGYMVLYGHSSGPVESIPIATLASGSYFISRPSLAHHIRDRQELLHRAGDVLSWVQSGELDVRIHDTFPLSDAKEAHRQLEGRQSVGKILLLP